MRIIAYLSSNEGGCNYSKHFREQWIDNKKLHPACKEIEVRLEEVIGYGKPEVYLMKSTFAKPLLIQVGNEIRPDILQDFILKHKEIEVR